MSAILHIKDNFFEDGSKARDAILSTPFQDVTSPVDNVTYPDINLSVPEPIQREFIAKIESMMGAKVVPNFLFARAMIEGRPVPHKVHSDFNMGDYTALVYLSDVIPDDYGTGIYKHDTQGLIGDAATDYSQIDHNSMERWKKYDFCKAEFNRICILDARYWHMAEPNLAWGKSPKDGRLVLTMFFNTVPNGS